MKKKKGLFFGAIVFAVVAFIYFRPLKLADLACEEQYILIQYQEIGSENGAPYIDSTKHNDITEDEKRKITEVLKRYSCRRTWKTVFSDGSLTGLGNEVVYIYIYDESDELVRTVFVSGSGDISMNGKVYAMKSAQAFIDELLEIIGRDEGMDGEENVGDAESPGILPAEELPETDLSGYFDGLKGAAVLYNAGRDEYIIYNKELAKKRTSPCSTFKIISSCIALENGIIVPEHSVRTWSGETFWNEKWNQDLDFEEAFRESCVWYFREVIDEIGPERMQEALDDLWYGNCDISDWEGNLNTNNSNPALTGFWIESSLKISPKEQTEVLERIFGEKSSYSADTQNTLKKVMFASKEEQTGISVYGKTGMGKAKGVVVDAWYTGFAEKSGKRVYFCVHLGENEGRDVSSQKAKEIALKLIEDYFEQGE